MALSCSYEAIEDSEQRQYTAISICTVISYIIIYRQFWFVLKDENLLPLSYTKPKKKNLNITSLIFI